MLAVAALYSAGAHGIMTLNDFKSVEGDRRMGIGSLPVRLGVDTRRPRRLRRDGVCRRSVVIALLLVWGTSDATPRSWRCCWRSSC